MLRFPSARELNLGLQNRNLEVGFEKELLGVINGFKLVQKQQ